MRSGYKLIVVLNLLCVSVQAQKVTFNGLGRAVVANNTLDGNVLKGDTLSPNRSTDGYVLFDLGINLRPYDYLRAKAIVRLRNKFGIFYGQGAAVEFRQVLIEGIVSKKVKYALGDIDLLLTPYTVFNNPEGFYDYEADAFRFRREIVHYENFNSGNNWRVQGVKANFNLLIHAASKIRCQVFASRTRPTNYYSLPDRFLTGGSVFAELGKAGGFGLNYTRFFELPSQIKGSNSVFKNYVLTVNFRLEKEGDKLKAGVAGEGGISYYKNLPKPDSGRLAKDFFYDLSGEAKLKALTVGFTAGYKVAGPSFYSPAAQTLRIDVTRAPALFPKLRNNSEVRDQLLFDRLTQENIYNQTILPVLMPFLPQYGNALPYGPATPNRKGFMLGITGGAADRLVDASLRTDFLSEMQGEGTASRRRFFLLRGGASLQLHKLFKSGRRYILSAGLRCEDTRRADSMSVSFSTIQLDGGLSVETIHHLDVMLGYKSIAAKGNEFMAFHSAFNTVSRFVPLVMDMRQSIYSMGLRYRFSGKSFCAFTANFTGKEQRKNESASYRISQYFIVYTVVF